MIKRDQRGFTLIELLVAMAIIALIGGAATTTTFQVLASTKRSNDHMTAIRQVQNAGYWISNDVQMAQGVDTDDVPETPELEFITLTWTNWVDGEVHEVIYAFHDMADGLKKLKRTHWTDGVEGGQTLVAEYIDSAASFFEQEDGIWKLTIQASPGTATETREYEVTPRIDM